MCTVNLYNRLCSKVQHITLGLFTNNRFRVIYCVNVTYECDVTVSVVPREVAVYPASFLNIGFMKRL